MNNIKRLTTSILTVTLMTVLMACGNPSSGTAEVGADSEKPQSETLEEITSGEQADTELERGSEETDLTAQEKQDISPEGSKTLVVYFSRTGEQYTVGVIDKGNTAIVAEMISEQTGADLWEVIPAEDIYPTDSYNDLIDVAKKEQNDNARPAYAGEAPDLSQYDKVFIGAPVWWGDWPMIMYTFFENNQDGLAGKTLIPFSTHEGSGLSGFDKKLSGACPESTVGKGLAIRGNDCQNEQDNVRTSVTSWLSELGY